MAAASMLAAGLAACLPLNAVREAGFGSAPKAKTARIVYGVQVETDWPAEAFTVLLDFYDPATGRGGDCRRNDRLSNAPIPPTPGGMHYFAFDAPPGIYAFSAMNGQSLSADSPAAFVAPAGQSVYLGDFVLSGLVTPGTTTLDGTIHVRRDIDAAKAELGKDSEHLVLAEIYPGVRRSPGFMCMP
jgi:hypothetical protein